MCAKFNPNLIMMDEYQRCSEFRFWVARKINSDCEILKTQIPNSPDEYLKLDTKLKYCVFQIFVRHCINTQRIDRFLDIFFSMILILKYGLCSTVQHGGIVC